MNGYAQAIQEMECLVGSKPASVETALLGVHESLTKFWVASQGDPADAEEMAKRVANLFISAALAAQAVGVTDIDAAIENRLTELVSQQ